MEHFENNKENASESLPAAVIFDCDGVLVDTEPMHYRAFQEVLQPLGMGHDYEHYLKRYIGFDDRDAFLEAFRESGRPADPGMIAGMMKSKAAALDRIAARGVPTFPGVLELVTALALEGIPLAVASGALRREVEMFIEALGVRNAFRVIVAADEVSRSKPDPETYVRALEKMREALGLERLDPASCLAIEDTPAGIESAKAAGIFVVAVAHSYPASRLEGLADHVVERLTGLNPEKLAKLLDDRRSRPGR